MATIIAEELSTEDWVFVFLTDSSRSSVVTTLSNSPALVKTTRKEIPEVASTRKRTAPDNLCQALRNRQIFLVSFFVLLKVFVDKRQELQAAKKNLEEYYRHHLRPKLMEVGSIFKLLVCSTRPVSPLYKL